MDKIHNAISDDISTLGGHLECTVCGHTRPLNGQISRWLATGWPKHCMYTMTWITVRQELENAR